MWWSKEVMRGSEVKLGIHQATLCAMPEVGYANRGGVPKITLNMKYSWYRRESRAAFITAIKLVEE